MYDYNQLSDDKLIVLSRYILPRTYPATDLYDEMCADLSILKVKELRGTIGYLRGQFFNSIFRSAPYWHIIDKHFRAEGICPLCRQHRTLIIYGPSYRNLGVNHLHPEDHVLACGDCHHMHYTMWRDTRLWRTLREEQEMQVYGFLDILRKGRP